MVPITIKIIVKDCHHKQSHRHEYSVQELNLVTQPIRARKREMSASLEDLHSGTKWDTIQIESPLSLVIKQQRLTYVSCNDDQNSVCSVIVDCQ